ncbi:hypothetical protein BU14_0143s0003 [Porphyra umbilicalis]|uniref:Methyltransferase type 11 domain-containing protein n=1 Tax=Porphyra umbilicalis TaxID=2786 RepID=A0A1X6P9R9_PORUM|nr:hypothetical protein BU14_0143s0003 [Porphyra umbilicalis]|eukprot:OSX77567.1 hypothetical protein BU14_0143s0003 [Porphyra umbilicalis]
MTGTNSGNAPAQAPEAGDTTSTVLAQYDTPESAQFYSVVMGDGGSDVHYGVYTKASDSTRDAAENTIAVLRSLGESAGVTFGPGVKVLDLGAGNGGAAHKLAAETGCSVTCLNLCAEQNAANRSEVVARDLSDLVTVVTGSFEKLPADWTASFNIVWSQDAIVHSNAKDKVFAEAARVLVPGGHVVMSDIMAGPAADASVLSAFKERLHVDELLTPSAYEVGLAAAGVTTLRTRDLSGQLVTNYRRMVGRISSERARLDRCSDAYLDTYAGLLGANIEALCNGEAQAWFALVGQKVGGRTTAAAAADADATVAPSPPLVRRWVASKLHGVRVTDKSVRYHGSVGVSRNLMAAAGIKEFEAVDVVNLTNGARWTTYALGIDADDAFTLNGGGARRGETGDECVLMTYVQSAAYEPARVAYCGADNSIIDQFTYSHKEEAGENGSEGVAIGNGSSNAATG